MARPKNKPLVIPVKIEGARETLKAFRELPKDASVEIRDAAGKISAEMVGWVQAAARAESAQAALMAPTVKVMRDRVPGISVGGTARVGSTHPTEAWHILFGAEFGANAYPQFKPHRGQQGYFIFPTVEANAEAISANWMAAADAIIDKWSANGGTAATA